MFWWLLLIYPLVGVWFWVDLGRKYKNIKYYSDWVDSADLLFLGLIWPVLVWGHYKHLNGRLEELAEEREREHDRLIERIRKEPDPLLADWDREFNELAGIEEVVPEFTWESAINDSWETKGFQHYDKPLNVCRDEPLPKGGTKMLAPKENIFWYPHETFEQRASLTKAYSRLSFSQGGVIPTTTELNDSAEFRVRDLGSPFSL